MSRAAPRIPRDVPQPKRKPNPRVRIQHREYVRKLPCLACGREGWSECAHVRMGADGGAGLKPHDRFTIPLCDPPLVGVEGCHDYQHRIGEPKFYMQLGIDPLDVALKLWTKSGDEEAGQAIIFKARQRIALKRGAA